MKSTDCISPPAEKPEGRLVGRVDGKRLKVKVPEEYAEFGWYAVAWERESKVAGAANQVCFSLHDGWLDLNLAWGDTKPEAVRQAVRDIGSLGGPDWLGRALTDRARPEHWGEIPSWADLVERESE